MTYHTAMIGTPFGGGFDQIAIAPFNAFQFSEGVYQAGSVADCLRAVQDRGPSDMVTAVANAETALFEVDSFSGTVELCVKTPNGIQIVGRLLMVPDEAVSRLHVPPAKPRGGLPIEAYGEFVRKRDADILESMVAAVRDPVLAGIDFVGVGDVLHATLAYDFGPSKKGAEVAIVHGDRKELLILECLDSLLYRSLGPVVPYRRRDEEPVIEKDY